MFLLIMKRRQLKDGTISDIRLLYWRQTKELHFKLAMCAYIPLTCILSLYSAVVFHKLQFTALFTYPHAGTLM